VHSQIDAPREQRFLDLLREHPLRIAIRCADFGKRHVLHRVAQRLNNLDRDLVPRPAQPVRNVMRLPQRELRPSRADAQHASLWIVVGIRHAGSETSVSRRYPLCLT
jgi:hypothetical protein